MANIIQTFPKGNGTDLSIIAEEFDNTKDYKVGNKVIKDKKYYVFTSDHNAGAWDSSDVDETNVSEEIPIGLTDEDMDEIKAQFHPVGYGNVRNYQIYSPTEHVVGEWQEMVDGVLKKKPVYGKRFDGTTPSEETTALSVSVSNIDILCEVNGRAGSSLSIPLMYQDNYNFFKGYKISSGLEIWCKGPAVLSKPYAITVCYTKTTDEWKEV